jgi:hypothetical protein
LRSSRSAGQKLPNHVSEQTLKPMLSLFIGYRSDY